MIFICIALVALPCVVSCFFSVGILCNYLQVVQTRMLTNVDNYILSHNVYVLLLLMFAKPWRGNAPPYLQLAFLCQYIYIIFFVHVNFLNFVISFTLHVL